MVVAATLVVGAGNGLVEAVCNPLIATLYPEEKTLKLTIFHAWFPGGIVIGGLLAFLFSKIGLNWQFKMGLLLVPSVMYLIMIFTQKFPPTERVEAGYSFGDMFTEALRRPLFLIIFLMMWITAATELGSGAWISNIYNDVMGRQEGILALVWGSILMFVLRQFFSKPIHKISPTTTHRRHGAVRRGRLVPVQCGCRQPIRSHVLLRGPPCCISACASGGPPMLGMTSERCPKTGALGLAIIGGAGSFATFVAGPGIGRPQ